ncbi:unnamed protein product, partial [Laminaria digitata]
MVGQGPRIRLVTETGTQVIITTLSTIFISYFLLAFGVVSLFVPLFFFPGPSFRRCLPLLRVTSSVQQFFFLKPFGSSRAICILCNFRIAFVFFI